MSAARPDTPASIEQLLVMRLHVSSRRAALYNDDLPTEDA